MIITPYIRKVFSRKQKTISKEVNSSDSRFKILSSGIIGFFLFDCN